MACVLAGVVHGDVDDGAVLREGGAQAVLHQAGAIHVHCVPLTGPAALRVRVRPWGGDSGHLAYAFIQSD